MNCKPGDLAIVVSAEITPEMIGRIVKVVRPVFSGETVPCLGTLPIFDEVVWLCSAEGGTIPARFSDGVLRHLHERAICDRFLRPIRDTEGQDETLTWAGKPNEVKA